MKLLFKTFLYVVFFLSPALVYGQNSETYLQNADKYFEQGDYERAVTNYIVASQYGQNVTVKLETAKQCLECLKLGDKCFFSENYEDARIYYLWIRNANPYDYNIKNKLTTLENIVYRNATLTIGMDYQGGRIAYLDATGKHGLIMTVSDISDGPVKWNAAKKLIDTLNIDGYSDWRLPSEAELKQISKYNSSLGWNNRLWTSTGESDGSIWGTSKYKVVEPNGYSNWEYQSEKYYVRAVRNF